MDEPRILTHNETARRHAEHGRRGRDAPISLCAWRDCPQVATYGPFCPDHRRVAVPESVATIDLTPDELEQVRGDVEARAAPLFLLAMDWIVRGQLAQFGISQLDGPITISREADDGEPA